MHEISKRNSEKNPPVRAKSLKKFFHLDVSNRKIQHRLKEISLASYFEEKETNHEQATCEGKIEIGTRS
jgi:hypothetical protein